MESERRTSQPWVDNGDHVATCEEFSKKFGGKRVINKILIANNGIAGEGHFMNR